MRVVYEMAMERKTWRGERREELSAVDKEDRGIVHERKIREGNQLP